MTITITCAYCGRSGMTSSREHVIPEALGGQLVTTDVCTQCNGDMGSQVDATFADSKYMQFVRLAYQDFLSPRAVPTILRDGEVADASGSERFPGRFRLSIAGIEFEPRYHTKVVGNVTTYYMPDTPDGKKNFDRLRSSRSKNIQSAEWIDLPAAPDSLTIARDMLLPYPREVIKMFLGFLAAEGMLELALRPTFDDAREYLQTGDAGRLGSGYEMSTGVRTGPLELDTATGHELGFTRDGPHDVFQILLFDCVLFQMKVHDKMSVIPQAYRRYSMSRKRSSLPVTLFRIVDPRQTSQ